VSLLALGIVIAGVDVAAAWTMLLDADFIYVLAVFGVLAVQFAVRGWRWRTILPSRPDGSPVPVTRTFAPLLVGYLGNAVLPARLGEPIRAVLVARREQLDTLESFGATMLERLIDTVTLALVGFSAAVALGAAWWIVAVSAVVGFGGLIALGLLAAIGLTRLTDVGAYLLGRVGLAERAGRLVRWTRSFAAGIDRGRDVRRLAMVMGASVVAWGLDASIFYLAMRALDIDLGFVGAILIGAVSVLATAVPAAPGFVGTFELAATGAGAALGVPRAEALAMAILVHVITLVPVALAGALVLVRSGIRLGMLAGEAEEVDVEQGAAPEAPDGRSG
jgi:uncharacterized protein (TIRG00374 family)